MPESLTTATTAEEDNSSLCRKCGELCSGGSCGHLHPIQEGGPDIYCAGCQMDYLLNTEKNAKERQVEFGEEPEEDKYEE